MAIIPSPKVASYGTWESLISAKMLASEDISLLQIAPKSLDAESNVTGLDKIYYAEGRAAQQGRRCIVECTFPSNGSAQLRDVLPQQYSARTSVHGYGGGAFTCQNKSKLIFSDEKTNGVYSLDPRNQQVDCIIPGNERVFYADFNACGDVHKHWILAVCEDHRTETIINSIVAIDTTTKTVHMIVSGADFYTSPQLNAAADGEAMLCWMQWNHPEMPWTGSQLFVASWKSGDSSTLEVPQVGIPRCIAGEPGKESVAQPKWNHANGSLLFCSDRSGYWQLYCLEPGRTTPSQVRLHGLQDGNFAGPEWWLGSSTFALLDRDTIVALWTKNAVQSLVMIDLKSSTYEMPQLPSIDNPVPSIQRVSDKHYVFIGSTKDRPEALYSVTSKPQPELTLLRSSSNLPISPAYFSISVPMSFPRIHGSKTEGLSHAIFLPPLNPDFIGPKGTLPPLVVHMHGGPTIHVGIGLSIAWQYWTTRGYALAAVNYSGSSGYSRAYRSRLDGQWGIADVADAASCVDHLASAGLIDKTRVGVVGGSSGGYACLQALCSYPDKFAGGVSICGISDVKALMQDTHKFESHYADRLLFGVDGRLSDREKESIIYERSPIHNAERIKAATLLLQGLEDKIVPPNQAERMIDAIREHDGDAKVVFFEGEGHGFAKAENQERSIVEQEQWWRKTLVRDKDQQRGASNTE